MILNLSLIRLCIVTTSWLMATTIAADTWGDLADHLLLAAIIIVFNQYVNTTKLIRSDCVVAL